MKISILTLFPEMFAGPFDHSILKHAKAKNLLDVSLVNIRDYGIGKHRMVDDTPYGGGKGMVMRVDVLDAAITNTRLPGTEKDKERIVLLDARGEVFRQRKAASYSRLDHLVLICGHYEGVDERVRHLVDETISVGDFILTGGELPAMLVTDAVARLVDGVLAKEATEFESFSSDQLEYPQYTKPREYKEMSVPETLLSGNHQSIEEWRKGKAKEITHAHRPDLARSD